MSPRINKSRWLSKCVRFLRQSLFAVLSSLFSLLVVVLVVCLVLYVESRITGKSLGNGQEVIQALKDSAILGALESLAIITSVIIFMLSGNRMERRQKRYDTLALLDASQVLTQSVTVREALQSLNQAGESFRQYSFVEDVDLRDMRLPNVDFSKATLPRVRFENAELNHADFWGAHLPDAHFERTSLQSADFRNACLQRADFTRSELKGALFEGADLQESVFKAATIHGVNFCRVRHLPLRQIVSAEGWQTAIFDVGVKEKLAELAEAQLSQARD
jgi:uncharacterized protein YjbI with pentapeptide repeats